MRSHPKVPLIFIIVFSLLGFADAAFLTVEHYRDAIIPCTITTGCQVVTTSTYSTIGPIPIALMGALYYLSVLVIAALMLETKRSGWIRFLPWLTAVGFAFSLYLVSLQAFALHAFCLYCLISAGTSTIIFIFSIMSRKFSKPVQV